MRDKKINSQNMKRNNANLVMNIVRGAECISRNDLARRTELTSATITNIVAELIQKGFIIEIGKEVSSNCGRRPVMLTVNPRACYVVGIELSASRVVGILTDFMANILARCVCLIDSQGQPEEIVDTIVCVFDEVVAKSGVQKSFIREIGLVTPGPSDVKHGVMIAPNNLPNIKNFPIRSVVSQRIGIPVAFEHHMAAAGFGEYWLGEAIQSHCLLLCSVLEIGVAGSILIDGKILHGFQDISGEIGHMVVDRNGPKCSCGDYGCLEALADGRALINAVKKLLKRDPALCEKYGIDDVDQVDLAYVIRAAERAEQPFLGCVEESAQYVAMALWNVIVTVSPDTIVLSGKLPCESVAYMEEIRRFLKAKPNPRYNDKIRIYSTRLKQDIFPLGAVALAMDDISHTL